MSEFLTLEKNAGVAVITWNHPKVNALSFALLQELRAQLDDLARDDATRVLVLTGAGEKFFSGGADIRELDRIAPRTLITFGQDLFRQLELFPKPTLAAVNGSAFGGGCELSLACHFRLAVTTAQFALPEIKLGILPGWGGVQRLTRLLGPSRALELLITGERIDAPAAERLGLIQRALPPAQFMAETLTWAKRLARGAPLAQRALLQLLRADDGDAAAAREQIIALNSTADAARGIAAFWAKQEPEFIGQ